MPSPEDLLLGQVDRVLSTRTKPKAPHRDFKGRIQLSAVDFVNQAAALRGMSVSAYLRRASLAFAAHDLGLDITEVLKDEPATRLKGDGPKADRREGGIGHGKWRITGLM